MRKIINYIPVGVFSIVATAFVAYVLLSPPSGFSQGLLRWFHFKNSDKVIHFLLFFFLNFAYLYDYTKLRNPHHTRINKELALTALAAALGLLSESAQLAMGLGRTFDNYDIIADALGAVAAFGVMRWFGSHLLRKHVFYSSHYRRHHRHRHSSH